MADWIFRVDIPVYGVIEYNVVVRAEGIRTRNRVELYENGKFFRGFDSFRECVGYVFELLEPGTYSINEIPFI